MSERDWEATPAARPSSVDAAFQGLQLVRREPLAFVAWMLLVVLFNAAMGGAQTVLFMPAFTHFQEVQAQAKIAGSTVAPGAAFAFLGKAWRFQALAMVLSLLFYAVMNAAVYRAVLQPTKRSFAYLRLGLDELRQAGLFVYIAVVWFAAWLAALVVLLILGVFAVVGLKASGAGAAAGSQAGLSVAVIVGLVAVMVAILVIMVRFSLSGPLTFDSKRVRLFDSWRLTRGRFGLLFGAYVLAAVLFLILGVLSLLLTGAVALVMGSGMGGVQSLMHPTALTIQGFFSPVRIVFLVLNAPLGAAWLATQAGVPAEVYAAIKAERALRRPTDLSHTFGNAIPSAPEGDFPITPRDL